MDLLPHAEARGLFLQSCRDLATPVRTRGGSAKQPLLPSEKEAQGSYKKLGELLMALCFVRRLGSPPCNLAETPRPRLAPKGPRQTNPQARGAYKKLGELPTALSPRAEARGLFLQPC